MSDGRLGKELDGYQIGKASTVMQALLYSVVMKRKMLIMAKLFNF